MASLDKHSCSRHFIHLHITGKGLSAIVISRQKKTPEHSKWWSPERSNLAYISKPETCIEFHYIFDSNISIGIVVSSFNAPRYIHIVFLERVGRRRDALSLR